MIKTLQFVRGAVADKDLIPVLTHFRISDGTIQGTNGRMTIQADCEKLSGIDIAVPAGRFLKAIDACDGEPTIKVTPAGKLVISNKKFRAILPLGDTSAFPSATADQTQITMDGELLPVLRKLRPFIGTDASRPWACGILLKDGFAYATNNVILCRVPCSWGSLNEPINLPSFAVDELIRIGREPEAVHTSDQSVTFSWGSRWLKTLLFDLAWPDVDNFFEDTLTPEIPSGLQGAVERVLPFCPDPKFPVITLGADGVATTDGEMMAEMGGLSLPDSRYRAEALLMVLGVATHADLAAYPAPVRWAGDGIEGVLVGVNA